MSDDVKAQELLDDLMPAIVVAVQSRRSFRRRAVPAKRLCFFDYARKWQNEHPEHSHIFDPPD
jgi:hypothetical protein